MSRASAAASRINPRLTEKGEHGAMPNQTIAPSLASWKRSMTRIGSARIAASSSTRLSGGNPPSLSPTLIAPRVAWKRTAMSSAAAIVSSSVTPFGNRYR